MSQGLQDLKFVAHFSSIDIIYELQEFLSFYLLIRHEVYYIFSIYLHLKYYKYILPLHIPYE